MICVLMSTYNGQKYLQDQLESIFKQQNVDLSVIVRDDGSTDSTLDILQRYSNRLTWHTGENLRPARSFWNLMMTAPDADYYAFADQDDVWEEHKLANACQYLEKSTKPALYFSQTQLVDSELKPMVTRDITPKCTFEESLLENYATGCTFVFNKALMQLARKYNPSYLTMHDYWIYRLCLVVGGDIYFDPISYVKYRQHNYNVVGLSKGWKTDLQRRYIRICKSECERSRTICELYKGYSQMMSPNILPLVEDIVNYKTSFRSKMRILFNSKLTSTKFLKNMSFRFAVIINRF